MSEFENIKTLEQIARGLELSPAARKLIMDLTIDHLSQFLDKNNDDRIFYPHRELDDSFPDYETPNSPEAVFAQMESEIQQIGLNAASPYHMAYIPGGGQVHGALGDLIGAVLNKYVGIYFVGPGGVKIENDLIKWMADLIGYDPETAGGSLASGGSIANLTAVVAARDAKLKQQDLPNAVVYTTTQTHHCVQKALRIAGFIGNEPGQEGNIRYIDIDNRFSMIPEALEAAIQEDKANGKIPWMIVASAGTTNFGNIDPLEAIGKIAQHHKIWYHIDAAYGGYFLLTDFGQKVLKGMALSDSVVLDAHKSMFLPYGLGSVIVKEKDHLFNSFYYNADYIQDEREKFSPANVSPELTKPFRSLRLWLPLKILGLQPFRAALKEKRALSLYFYDQLSNWAEVEMINAPEITVFAFRWIPEGIKDDEAALNKFQQTLLSNIVQDGRVFLSGTWYTLKSTGQQRFVIRITILCFRTHLEHVENALQVIREMAERLEEEMEVK